MTNFEWLIENDVKDMLCDNNPWGVKKETNEIVKDCRHIACPECVFYKSENPCSTDRRLWLNAEHEEPLLFPIGTIVEVSDSDNTKHTGYYNGFENGKHYVTHYRHFLDCRYHDGELHGGKYDAIQLRKVGDSNA